MVVSGRGSPEKLVATGRDAMGPLVAVEEAEDGACPATTENGRMRHVGNWADLDGSSKHAGFKPGLDPCHCGQLRGKP